MRTSSARPRLAGQPQPVAAAARKAAVAVARQRQLLRCRAAAEKEGDGSSSTQQQTAGTPAVPDTPPTPTGAAAQQQSGARQVRSQFASLRRLILELHVDLRCISALVCVCHIWLAGSLFACLHCCSSPCSSRAGRASDEHRGNPAAGGGAAAAEGGKLGQRGSDRGELSSEQ